MINTNNYAFYNPTTSRVCVVSCAHPDEYFEVRKVSDLELFYDFRFINAAEFISRHPEAELERYINGEHNDDFVYETERYLAAYMHLFRCYESLAVLAANGFSRFIDGFIDSCFAENTDHPATIGYTRKQLYKVLRLRKSVYDMFEPYLKDYDTYNYIFTLQNQYKYSDSDFRKVRKEFKESKVPALVYPEVNETSKSGLKLLA